MNRVFRNTIFYLLILLVVIGVVSYFQTSNPKTENMSYSTFIKNLDEGKVDSVSVQPVRGVYEVKGQLKKYDKDQYFLTHVPEGKGADQIFDAIKKTDVKVDPAQETSGWVTFLTTIIPFANGMIVVKNVTHPLVSCAGSTFTSVFLIASNIWSAPFPSGTCVKKYWSLSYFFSCPFTS